MSHEIDPECINKFKKPRSNPKDNQRIRKAHSKILFEALRNGDMKLFGLREVYFNTEEQNTERECVKTTKNARTKSFK